MRIPESAAFRLGQLDERSHKLRAWADANDRERAQISAAFGLPLDGSVTVVVDPGARPVGTVLVAKTGEEWNPPTAAPEPAPTPALAVVPGCNGVAVEPPAPAAE